MTARCERPGCGKPMPARRNDGTGMKRRFCCRQCGYHQGQRIVINGDKANAPKVESTGSWWIEPDFDAKAIAEPVTGNARGGANVSSINGAKNAQRGGKDSPGLGKDWPFDTRNKRSVWTIPTAPYHGAHFATFPERLVEPCVLAGCPMGGLVLDPFIGSGTVGAVAERTGRRWVGTDLSYQPLSQARTAQRGLMWEAAL